MISINHDTNLGGISFLTTKNTERGVKAQRWEHSFPQYFFIIQFILHHVNPLVTLDVYLKDIFDNRNV